ncbi:polymorphic outer membrane protein B [Chlamydia felis Fe/C-56]|uniref:Polymorphic outer membrane protein B n=3 Tax=Chlamydia felis TaxID=83556 RepID=Q253G4_CHLFF|nr:polymorphic outer membrane protein middle domain-containing protein [Chlamydia felis]ABO20815.1 Pmp20 [Chlamydia felis]ABO20821.1 Pmp20 [Chlamydia felis]BAE81574.1 polymorphic outer membrane protein B [Chlamydia felis Fe/C-56]
MKWLSATAVFAAVLPSITVFCDPLSKELNSNYRGSGSSTADARLTNFTQQTQDASGITYLVSGDVSFSNFTNIPDPKPQPPSTEPETSPETKDSAAKSSESSNPASITQNIAHLQTQLYQSLFQSLGSSSFAPHFSDRDQGNLDLSNYLFSNIHSLSFPFTASAGSTTTTTTTPEDPKGGGAFYNDKDGPLSFTTYAGNPGSLSCSLIKMKGKGGAIYSKGPISFDGLENLTFKDNLSQQSGGALFTDSTLTIRNILNSIEFTTNAARVPIPLIPIQPAPTNPPAGSAVTGTLLASDSSEKKAANTSPTLPVYTTETAGNGGAAFATGAMLITTYKDMTFRRNSAEFPAIIDTIQATIDANKNKVVSAVPKSSQIISAAQPSQGSTTPEVIKGSGGALFGLDTITVSEGSGTTLFILNTATGNGGAVYGDKAVSFNNITSLKFQSNSADKQGGAIYSKGNLTIQDSSLLTMFNGNNGKTGGGAIYSLGDITLSNLSQVSFGANKAGNYDITITVKNDEGTNAIVPSVQSKISSALLASPPANLSASASAVDPAPNPPLGKGGGIYVGNNLSISNITSTLEFVKNQSTDSGGGVYVKGTLTCQDSHRLQFVSNSSKKSGGGLYSETDVTFTNLTGNTLFQGNTAEEDGGGICLANEKSLNMSNLESFCLIGNTSTKKNGGGANIPKALSLTFSAPNSSPDAILSETPAVIPVFGSAIISGNKAVEGNGGGIYTKKASFTNLELIDINQNSAKNGAGLCTQNISSSAASASGVGGLGGVGGFIKTSTGISSQKSEVAAVVSGAPAATPDDLDFKVDYVVTTNITKNAATENGGGVYGNKGQISRLDLLNITENSSGKCGGGLYFQETLTLEGIEVSNISNNTAKESGGALYAKTLTCKTFTDGLTVSNNKAETTSTVSGTNVVNASAAATNGALQAATLTEKFSTDNKAEAHASVAPAAQQASVPTAITGGALYAETLTLEGLQSTCAFSGNQAIDNNATDSTADTPADPDIQGGAIYAKTKFTLQNCSGNLTFKDNSVLTKRSQTTGQLAGGAIYAPTVEIKNCSQAINFSNNSASCTPKTAGASEKAGAGITPKESFGGAIAGTTSITFTGNQAIFFQNNSADIGSAIGCKNGNNNNGTVTFSDSGYYLFEGNTAKNRGTIYATTLSIPNGYLNFSNNSSANDGSAIYFTKQADITAGSSVLFLNNKVTLAQTPTSKNGKSAVNNLGAAIYGEPTSSSDDANLNLTALGGSITFKNNGCTAPTRQDNQVKSFCSIAGKVKLTLNAAENHSINFYDAVNITTQKTSDYNPLDINKPSNGKTSQQYTGTVLFSGELHEHKSFIPQKATLHAGTLVLGKNAELSLISFEQKPGSLLVMGPGSVLSTHKPTASGSAASGGIVINNITIDFSEIVSDNGVASPPTLKLGATPTPIAAGPGAHRSKQSALPQANKQAPDVDQEKIYLTGTLTLIDPSGVFYQNPYLGQDREIELLALPQDSSKVDISDLTLAGDTKPLKGYIGTWELQSTDQNGKLQAKWKFEEYRRWIYIPRDNYFYVNSILGSQNSLIAVKQGVVNNMLNNARFDDAAYNNLWLSGIGSFLQKSQGEESREFTYHGRGYSLAIDAKPRPELILGAAFSQVFGHAKSEKTVDNYKHKGSDHSFQGTLYAGRAFYLPYKRTKAPRPILLQGVVTYGYMKHDTTTYYPSIQERNLGNWEDLGWMFDVRMIMDLKEPSQNSTTRFSFYSEAEYTGVRQKQFTELDYDPRTFDSFAYRNLAIPLGFVMEGALMQYDILMYNKLSLAYVPVIYRNKPKCSYRVDSTGQTGEVYGVIPTRNAARAEYSTQLYLGPYWTLYGTYTVEAGMSSLVQIANCGARMIF